MIRPDATPEPWQEDAELDRELRGTFALVVVMIFAAMAAAFWTGWLARGWFI